MSTTTSGTQRSAEEFIDLILHFEAQAGIYVEVSEDQVDEDGRTYTYITICHDTTKKQLKAIKSIIDYLMRYNYDFELQHNFKDRVLHIVLY